MEIYQKESFKEIWTGETRKNIMSKLNPKQHCRFHCIRHHTNLKLEKILAGEKVEEIDITGGTDNPKG